MKMKNYLNVPIGSFESDDLDTINVSISHREILRISERFLSEGSIYKVVNRLYDDSGRHSLSNDLHVSVDGRVRYFEIVKN